MRQHLVYFHHGVAVTLKCVPYHIAREFFAFSNLVIAARQNKYNRKQRVKGNKQREHCNCSAQAAAWVDNMQRARKQKDYNADELAIHQNAERADPAVNKSA